MSNQGFSDLPQTLILDGLGFSSMDLHPDRVMDVWVLGTIEHGHMPLAIGDLSHDLHPGEYFLLPPGIRHRGLGRASYAVTFWHFRCDTTQPPCYRLPWFGAIPADLDSAQLMRTAERMLHRSDDWRWIAALLQGFVARLSSHHRDVDAGESSRIADAVLAWLLDHRGEAWNRKTLERHVGYSYRYLNRLFHARFGQAIRARHLDLRIDLAADLIAGGMPLKRAATETGFGDYFNFLRRFRHRKKTTAGAFQRTMLGAASTTR